MEKIIKDDMVAVAVHSSYGNGWSTGTNVHCCDARFNHLFLEGKWLKAEALCKELGLGYAAGARHVRIEWVKQGTKFLISEYDGWENIQELDDLNFIEA
jgi:hypothetical protein